jgi:hypothetical protein
MIFAHHVMIPQTRPHPEARLALPSVSRVNSREVFLAVIIPESVCSPYFSLKQFCLSLRQLQVLSPTEVGLVLGWQFL